MSTLPAHILDLTECQLSLLFFLWFDIVSTIPAQILWFDRVSPLPAYILLLDINQVQPAHVWHQHCEWGAHRHHPQWVCQASHKGQHSPQHQMGDCEEDLTILWLKYVSSASVKINTSTFTLRMQLWIKDLNSSQNVSIRRSILLTLESLFKKHFLTFTFHTICKIKLNMDVLLQILYYSIFFLFVTLSKSN